MSMKGIDPAHGRAARRGPRKLPVRAGWFIAFALSILLTVWGAEPTPATLPQSQPESPRESTGRVIQVAAGEDLQAALDMATPGDVIELEAGAVYTGNFILPRQPESSEWVHIRVASSDSALPPPGTRVSPADSAAMAVLTASSGTILSTAAGAQRYRLTGIEFRPVPGQSAPLNTLVWIGAQGRALVEQPSQILIERCYLHGDPVVGTRRGIVLNGAATTIRDSYFADFMTLNTDSQAIIGWAGPGPYSILNNYLEASGENLMFGGADPAERSVVPSDITIRGNYFSKPLRWKEGTPEYAGTRWQVKNLLELKNARRVLISGNVFEHNWIQSQNGFAILFTVRNQENTAPWSVVEDITFSDNLVRRVGSGINILGYDDINQSQQTKRIHIHNNLFTEVGGEWGNGTLLQLLNGTAFVSFQNNTALQSGRILNTEGPMQTGFVFRNNILPHNQQGMIGTGTSSGNHTLTTYFANPEVRGNILVGAAPNLYPAGNETPRNFNGVGFVDFDGGNLRLSPDSRYAGRAGTDPGADLDRLCAALSPTDRPAFCAAPETR
jgi:Disaggregatase related.